MDRLTRIQMWGGDLLYRFRQHVGLALLAGNGWTANRCASCVGAGCILLMDVPGYPERCPFECDNDDRVCFGGAY